MKLLKLKPTAITKLLKGELELTSKDVDEVPKGATPGEWIFLVDETNRKKYLGYVNPHSESYHNIKVLKSFSIETKFENIEETILNSISEKIENAIKKRELFNVYQEGARLVYGHSDQIPGLIVDMYEKYILIQINTAGLDKYREQIKEIFKKYFNNKSVVLFDSPEYRRMEILPIHEPEIIEEDLSVIENGLKYLIAKKSIQKIGFYYDHRENRKKLKNKIIEMNIAKEKGLDLFSYVGSWGLHLLSAGVKDVVFVDQADMEKNIQTNLELNGFKNQGSFIRADVFKFLDEAISKGLMFDVVVSDPPAFTKSEKTKNVAITGYEKLHTKAMKLVKNNGLFAVASCTHYVDIMELDKTVYEAAIRNNCKIQLLDIGIQGHDHPMKNLKDRSSYIKYLLYLVQRG